MDIHILESGDAKDLKQSFFKKICIFQRGREGERACTCTCASWGGAEKGGQRIQSGLHADSREPM